MSRSRYGYDPTPRKRIDARPQNSTATQIGMTGVHRDTSGNVIGGYDRYGRGFGTKDSGEKFVDPRASITPRLDAGPRTPGLDARDGIGGSAMPNEQGIVTMTPEQSAARGLATPGAVPPPSGRPTPAWRAIDRAPDGSALLKDRQALYTDMQKAGSGGLTPDMQARAHSLGVSDAAWRRTAAKVPQAPAALIPPVTPPVAAAPTPPPPQAAAAPDIVTRAQNLQDAAKLAQAAAPAFHVADPYRGINPASDAIVAKATGPTPTGPTAATPNLPIPPNPIASVRAKTSPVDVSPTLPDTPASIAQQMPPVPQAQPTSTAAASPDDEEEELRRSQSSTRRYGR